VVVEAGRVAGSRSPLPLTAARYFWLITL
jgi:hypothetical protein